MASQPPPGDRTPRNPPSVPATKSRSYVRKCVILVDWWLERMDGKVYIAGLVEIPPRMMRKGGLSSQGSGKSAARVFRCAIARVCDYSTVETVNGYVIHIKGVLNNSRMRENGFSEEVCESFMDGFPLQWNELIDSNMEHTDRHSQSPSNSADDDLAEHYMEFMSDRFVSSKGYSFAENSFSLFRNLASPDLVGEPGTPKCCKTSVNLGAENASKVPVTGMTPLSGAVLRSGRVLGGPISAPNAAGNKPKRTRIRRC